MNKLLHLYKKYMVRPILYKSITKASIVLALSLIWVRFFNTSEELHLTDYVFPIAGIVLLCCSWFQYMKLDGIKVIKINRGRRKKRRFWLKTMIDYSDEEVVSFADLEPEEQTACNLASNLLTGAVYLGIAVLAAVIGA